MAYGFCGFVHLLKQGWPTCGPRALFEWPAGRIWEIKKKKSHIKKKNYQKKKKLFLLKNQKNYLNFSQNFACGTYYSLLYFFPRFIVRVINFYPNAFFFIFSYWSLSVPVLSEKFSRYQKVLATQKPVFFKMCNNVQKYKLL